MANIQNELNNIKNAIYGKDVRNSIHDAIKQCYDDASVNNDNANMEVKLARGVHNTLNDRLSKSDKKQEKISSQLEHKANENEVFLKQNGINMNDLDEETRQAILENNSIDINYVLGVENVKNINVADNTVDYNNTTFFDIEKSVNVFDYTKAIDGYIVNGEYGTLQEHSEGCVSDYIRVNPGDMLRFDNNWEGCFYNKDKQHHSKKEFGETERIVPEGAYFYRHNVSKALKQSFMITINKPIPTSYTPFYENIDFNEKTKEILKRFLENEKISPDDTDFATRKSTINLFNKETITNGYIVGNTGELIPHSDGGCASDFIEVNELEKIYINSNWNGCCYDKNKNFLWQKEFGETEFITPANTKYIRMSLPYSNKDSYMVSRTPITEYVKFDGYFKFTDNNDLLSIAKQLSPLITTHKSLNGKKWVVVGDSLTEKNSRTTKNYHDYIAEETGINVYNMGVGGTGYKRMESQSDGYRAFYQRIVDVPLDADIITIFGSGNDLSLIDELGNPSDATTDTICGCMNETFKRLFERIPGAKVGVVLPCPWGNYPPTISDNAMAKYSEALREVAKRYSIPVLDLYYGSNLRPWDETFKELYYKRDDGNSVHPDEDGHKILANKFKMFIQSL